MAYTHKLRDVTVSLEVIKKGMIEHNYDAPGEKL